MHLWIVRTLVPARYRQFTAGEISDKALADAVFANGRRAASFVLRIMKGGKAMLWPLKRR